MINKIYKINNYKMMINKKKTNKIYMINKIYKILKINIQII